MLCIPVAILVLAPSGSSRRRDLLVTLRSWSPLLELPNLTFPRGSRGLQLWIREPQTIMPHESSVLGANAWRVNAVVYCSRTVAVLGNRSGKPLLCESFIAGIKRFPCGARGSGSCICFL